MFRSAYPLLVLPFAFFYFSCIGQAQFKANTLRLQPWHSDANALEPYAYPFIAKYEKGKKQLIFVATEHVTGIKNSTTNTIQWTFDKFHPQVLVIEGFDNDLGTSPFYFINATANCAKNSFNECGEPYFSMQLAIQHHIPFLGGEPGDLNILESLRSKGYSAKDLLGLMILRQVPQWQQEGKMAKNGFEKLAQKMLLAYSKKLKIMPPFSLNEFYHWYSERSGSKEIKRGLILEDTGPHIGAYASYFQKLSHHISMQRDRFIVELVARLFIDHDAILIVYGGSHHFVQQPVYEEMMGTPAFLKPF